MREEGGRVDVLLVDLAARTGGTERRVVHVAQGLRMGGVRALVVCLERGELVRSLRAEGLPFVTVPHGRGDPRTLLVVARHIRRVHPRVLDAHNVQSQLWGFAATVLSRVDRRVATVHSEYRWSEGGVLKGRAYEAVLRLLALMGWRFVSVSDSVTRYLLSIGVAPGRVVTIWSALEDTPPRDQQERAVTRRALQLEPDHFVVACVARLVPAKNHDLLLDAVASLKADMPHLRVLVVGDGPQELVLRRRIKELGLSQQVLLLGHRTDVPALLAASDLCVLTSRTEGLPYALLEAVREGTPVLATRVGAIPTFFRADDTALLIDSEDVQQLQAVLRRASSEPGALVDMAARARRRMVETAGLDAMLDQTLDTYGLQRPRDGVQAASA